MTSAWTKYSVHLALPPGSVRRLEPVDFAASLEGAERVDLDEISLTPDDAIDTFDPDVVKMAAAMHVTELRLGGNFSSYYHWRDGIGPRDKAESEAAVRQISAVSRYVVNDEVEPKRVVPQPSSLHLEPGEPFLITLRHESVTVIHLRSR